MTIGHGNKCDQFAVAGLGRCGRAVASAIAAKGLLAAVWNRSEHPMQQWVDRNGSGKVRTFHGNLADSEFVTTADCFVVCVSDNAVPTVVEDIARAIGRYGTDMKKRIAIIHLSGVTATLPLERQVSVSVGSLHPAFSFSGNPDGDNLEGSVGAITARKDSSAETCALHLADLLKLKTCEIDDAERGLWHAACTMAANHLVTLAEDAVNTAMLAGVNRRLAVTAMTTLMKSACKRIEEDDTGIALTGAVSRGDVDTVRQHIEVLSNIDDRSLLQRYRAMSSATADLAMRSNRISEQTGRLIHHALD